MPADEDPILIYTTLPSLEEARRVGGALVERRLAACVNILPGMVAVYEWQGAMEEGQEAAMLIKTRRGLQERAIDALLELHPYETPAALVLEVGGGSAAFCAWIADQTRSAG